MSSQIIIEKSPTPVAPGKRHFNMRGSPVVGRDVWDVKKLLEVNDFSERTDSSGVLKSLVSHRG